MAEAHASNILPKATKGYISEQGFKFKGRCLSVSIRTIYFYINIHLHNSSPVAFREKPSRQLLSDELKMYLWEYPRHRVGIVMG